MGKGRGQFERKDGRMLSPVGWPAVCPAARGQGWDKQEVLSLKTELKLTSVRHGTSVNHTKVWPLEGIYRDMFLPVVSVNSDLL